MATHLRTHSRRHEADTPQAHAPRLADATTWLVLGLLVAVVLVLMGRHSSAPSATTPSGSPAAAHGSRAHDDPPGRLAAPASVTVVPPRDRPTVTDEVGPSPPEARRAAVTRATTSPTRPTAARAVRPRTQGAPRAVAAPPPPLPSATTATTAPVSPPATQRLSERLAGRLRFPDDVASTYPFLAGGGRVVLVATASREGPLEVALTCGAAHRSGLAEPSVRLSVVAAGGPCEASIAEVAGSTSISSYHLTLTYPAGATGAAP